MQSTWNILLDCLRRLTIREFQSFKHSLDVVTQNVNETAAKHAQAKAIVREASAAIQVSSAYARI